jgi:hypothetical protein
MTTIPALSFGGGGLRLHMSGHSSRRFPPSPPGEKPLLCTKIRSRCIGRRGPTQQWVQPSTPNWRWMTISGTLAGHVDGVRVPELVWREASPDGRRPRGRRGAALSAGSPQHDDQVPRRPTCVTRTTPRRSAVTSTSGHARDRARPDGAQAEDAETAFPLQPSTRGGTRTRTAAKGQWLLRPSCLTSSTTRAGGGQSRPVRAPRRRAGRRRPAARPRRSRPAGSRASRTRSAAAARGRAARSAARSRPTGSPGR